MKAEDERKKEFLIGLTKLTRATGIVISGCGCCGSPNLDAIEDESLSEDRSGYGYGDHGKVEWLAPCDASDWERYSESIVK